MEMLDRVIRKRSESDCVTRAMSRNSPQVFHSGAAFTPNTKALGSRTETGAMRVNA